MGRLPLENAVQSTVTRSGDRLMVTVSGGSAFFSAAGSAFFAAGSAFLAATALASPLTLGEGLGVRAAAGLGFFFAAGSGRKPTPRSRPIRADTETGSKQSGSFVFSPGVNQP